MDAEEKRKQLEIEILKIIEEKLLNGSMDVERAKLIARMVLDKLHPPLPLEQLYAVVPTLDDEFSELTKAVLPIMKEHDDLLREVITKHAHQLIASGKIDEAHTLLKSDEVKEELITQQ